MRALVVLLLGVAVLAMAGATQADNTKSSWTESFAEKQVLKNVRYHDSNSYTVQAQYHEAKSRLDDARRQTDACRCRYDELTQALSDFAIAERNLEEANQGHPVVDATCLGSGPAIKGIRFKHFRCVVLVHIPGSVWGDYAESLRRGRVLVHVLGPMTMTYQWI